MTVTLTSPVLGKNVGDTYTGSMEAWLLAEGYASQAGYTGPGVSNTGAASTTPANDPQLHDNREAPYFPGTPDRHVTIANDATNLNLKSLAAPGFDLDTGGTDTEQPSDVVLDPTELPLAGGEVIATGNNLEGLTGVTVGGTAATGLDTSEANDGVVTFTAPAKAAGTYDVVLTDNVGSTTITGGLTYA